MIHISSKDLSLFVYGRKILKEHQTAHICFTPNTENPKQAELWSKAVQYAVHNSRFGNIGFWYDRKNKAAKKWLQNFSNTTYQYTPTDNRALEIPKFKHLCTQILAELTNEGLSDSVEFRRFARKQLRPAKHAHVDMIVCFDDILAEEKTRNIIQNILGPNIKIVFAVDFFTPKITSYPERNIVINHSSDSSIDSDFLYHRAESILKTKLKK